MLQLELELWVMQQVWGLALWKGWGSPYCKLDCCCLYFSSALRLNSHSNRSCPVTSIFFCHEKYVL